MKLPWSMAIQAEQRPQGFELTPASQLSDFARILESVVLPTPRVPVRRYA